jgi:hypothetical protein
MVLIDVCLCVAMITKQQSKNTFNDRKIQKYKTISSITYNFSQCKLKTKTYCLNVYTSRGILYMKVPWLLPQAFALKLLPSIL